MLAQSFIPLITGRMIDGPIDTTTRRRSGRRRARARFGVAEAVLFFVRRYTMAWAALGLESDMRRDLFAHLQRLPVAFHDRWPSGQLLSRATTDLSTDPAVHRLRLRVPDRQFGHVDRGSGLLLHIHLVLGLS